MITSFIERLSEKPYRIGIVLLIIIGFIVIGITFCRTNYNGAVFDNILIEAHGLLFDILIFAILIAIFNMLGEKRRDIKRWKEEIDDYRNWSSEESKHRIIGNIKRLNKKRVTEIDLSYCYLEHAILGRDPDLFVSYVEAQKTVSDLGEIKSGRLVMVDRKNFKENKVNLEGAILIKTRLQGVSLIEVTLKGANLYRADLRNAELYMANFERANLSEANLQNATLKNTILTGANLIKTNLLGTKYLNVDQLSRVESLYQAKLDENLLEQVRQKYPHLLEKPKGEASE